MSRRQIQVHLSKSHIDALIDLAMRGRVNKPALKRVMQSLSENTRPRQSIEIWLSEAELAILRLSVAERRRSEGLTQAIQPLVEARKTLRATPRGVSAQRGSGLEDNERIFCECCKQYRPKAEFIRNRGIRCIGCRRAGVSGRPIKVVRG